MTTSKRWWLLSITPTPHGLARHPEWTFWARVPCAVYDKPDLDRRVREIHAALAADEISAFNITKHTR
jgi:hypothetical protein